MKCEILVVIKWKKQSGSKGSFPTIMNMITTETKSGLRREDDWKSGAKRTMHIYVECKFVYCYIPTTNGDI